MTSNIIPSDKSQEKRMGNPGMNNHFVGSREGGPAEHSRTKQESIKHQNPEYFKRQTDRAMKDGGPGSGPQKGGTGGGMTSEQKAKEERELQAHIEERKAANARTAQRHKREQLTGKQEVTNVGKDSAKRDNLIKGYADPKSGRGIGQTGTMDKNKDGGAGSGPNGNELRGRATPERKAATLARNRESQKNDPERQRQMNERKFEDKALKKENSGGPAYTRGNNPHAKKDNIPARKDVPIQRDFNKHQKNVGNDPGRGVGQIGRDQGNFQMKNFSKGTMY